MRSRIIKNYALFNLFFIFAGLARTNKLSVISDQFSAKKADCRLLNAER